MGRANHRSSSFLWVHIGMHNGMLGALILEFCSRHPKRGTQTSTPRIWSCRCRMSVRLTVPLGSCPLSMWVIKMSPSIPHAIYHLPSLALHQGLCEHRASATSSEGCTEAGLAEDICAMCPGSTSETKAYESVKGSERARCTEKGQLRVPDAEAQGSGVLGQERLLGIQAVGPGDPPVLALILYTSKLRLGQPSPPSLLQGQVSFSSSRNCDPACLLTCMKW